MTTARSKTTEQMSELDTSILIKHAQSLYNCQHSGTVVHYTLKDLHMCGCWVRDIRVSSSNTNATISPMVHSTISTLADFLYGGPVIELGCEILPNGVILTLRPMITATTTEDNGPHYKWVVACIGTPWVTCYAYEAPESTSPEINKEENMSIKDYGPRKIFVDERIVKAHAEKLLKVVDESTLSSAAAQSLILYNQGSTLSPDEIVAYSPSGGSSNEVLAIDIVYPILRELVQALSGRTEDVKYQVSVTKTAVRVQIVHISEETPESYAHQWDIVRCVDDVLLTDYGIVMSPQMKNYRTDRKLTFEQLTKRDKNIYLAMVLLRNMVHSEDFLYDWELNMSLESTYADIRYPWSIRNTTTQMPSHEIHVGVTEASRGDHSGIELIVQLIHDAVGGQSDVDITCTYQHIGRKFIFSRKDATGKCRTIHHWTAVLPEGGCPTVDEHIDVTYRSDTHEEENDSTPTELAPLHSRVYAYAKQLDKKAEQYRNAYEYTKNPSQSTGTNDRHLWVQASEFDIMKRVAHELYSIVCEGCDEEE